MRKKSSSVRDFLKQIIIPLFGVIALDQGSKSWAMHGSGLTILFNQGIIGGAFAQAPQLLKMWVIFAVFFITISFFISIQFLFFKFAKPLSTLISVLLAAFSSNLIDKLQLGGAVDFIPIQLGADRTVYFNVADFIQQITLVVLFIYLFVQRQTFWPLFEFRKTWIIDRSFQVSSALFTSVFSTTAGAAVAFLAYIFIVSYGIVPDLRIYSISMALFLFCFFIAVFFSSLIFFNRAAGPVYAGCKFIDQLTEGKYGQMKLRKTDYFKSLESSLNRLAVKLMEKESR